MLSETELKKKYNMKCFKKNIFRQCSENMRFVFVFLVVALFISVSCNNLQHTTKAVTAIETVDVNVLYMWNDNHIKIAASGYNSSDLEVSIDNGTISGREGEYIVCPEKAGKAVITVKSKGVVIQQKEFRVKSGISIATAFHADSIDFIDNIKSQYFLISKEDLLAVDSIIVVATNSDFNPGFNVVGFDLFFYINDSVVKTVSPNNKFTEDQKSLINETAIGSKLWMNEIRTLRPSGSISFMPSIQIIIVE